MTLFIAWKTPCFTIHEPLGAGIVHWARFALQGWPTDGDRLLVGDGLTNNHKEWLTRPGKLTVWYSLRTWKWPSRNSWFTQLLNRGYFHSYGTVYQRVPISENFNFAAGGFQGRLGGLRPKSPLKLDQQSLPNFPWWNPYYHSSGLLPTPQVRFRCFSW